LLRDSSSVPFELLVERICKIYHKLPSEVLEEDVEWIELLLYINKFEAERQDLEEKRSNLRRENK